MRTIMNVLVLFSFSAFIGCRSEHTEVARPHVLPSMTELENMVYQSAFTNSGAARLVNGAYQEQKDDGFGTVIVVTLTSFRLTGFLNANTEGSVAVVRTSAGANGTYYDLSAVVKDSAGVRNIAYASLGDRIKVTNVVLEDHVIRVQMTTHTPQDQPCCPSMEVVNTYELRGSRLVQIKSEPFVE
jgi:hypothetical protein